MSATATAPERRTRPNPCLAADGAPRRGVPAVLTLLLEGRVSALPHLLMTVFVAGALGTGAFAALTHLAGPDATGLLVVVWLVVGAGALAVWGDVMSFAAFGWLLLAAVALTVFAQVAHGADDAIGTFASVVGSGLLVGVAAVSAVACARGLENRSTGHARRAAWAFELAALLAAGIAFALLLPFAPTVQAGVGGLVMLALMPQVLALLRGQERVAASGPGEPLHRAGGRSERSTVTDPTVPLAENKERAAASKPAHKSPTPPREKLDDLLAELESYPGLDAVKSQVRELVAFLTVQRARAEHGMKAAAAAAHLRFEGGPGTGKTEMARLIARILAALEVVERGHLVEASRSELVGPYQGHTARAVNELCDEAQGGVLFVDEAYALFGGQGDSFGAEAVNELIKRMEDDRESFVVILAGYPREMSALMDSNPGLRSRVKRIISFPDYSPDELLAIAHRFAATSDYTWDAGAAEELRRALSVLYAERDASWGNAREVRKLYELATMRQALRLNGNHPSEAELRNLTAADVQAALQQYRAERDADRAGRRQAQPAFPRP